MIKKTESWKMIKTYYRIKLQVSRKQRVKRITELLTIIILTII